jgi:hypothetical protein
MLVLSDALIVLLSDLAMVFILQSRLVLKDVHCTSSDEIMLGLFLPFSANAT